jgi:hypothetical protein
MSSKVGEARAAFHADAPSRHDQRQQQHDDLAVVRAAYLCYRSGQSWVWLKSKNPASDAVRREREEEWR